MFYLGVTQLLFDSWFATGKESNSDKLLGWLPSKLSCGHISVVEVNDVIQHHGVSTL